MTLMACRENDSTGLPLCVTKLIGDDDTAVKKAQLAIDAWQKAARKAELIKAELGKKEHSAK
jgi:hypothetical protein